MQAEEQALKMLACHCDMVLHLPCLQASANWLEVIQDDSLDAIVVGTWPYMHHTLVLQALQHGKHVLTEARLVSAVSRSPRCWGRVSKTCPAELTDPQACSQ